MVEFSNHDDVERWLKGKPREVATVIAARAALRVVPMLASVRGLSGGNVRKARKVKRHIILPAMRAAAASWVAAKYPTRRRQVRRAAFDAASVSEVAPAASEAVRSASHAAYAAAFNDPNPSAQTVNYAANAVASAARAATVTADAYAAASADASAIEKGMTPDELAGWPLWPMNAPPSSRANWMLLCDSLVRPGQDWEVWTDWYDARDEGVASNEELEIARVLIKEEIWEQGPRVVNAEIKRLIDEPEARASNTLDEPLLPWPDELSVPLVDAVPSQGPGPRFRATEDGPIDRAPPADLDTEGNDTKTIDRLRPLALRCAADLKTRLPPNQFGELLSAVDLYAAALDPGEGKTIEWGVVWGHGVILQNAASSAERMVDERILPALEDPAKTALESLLTLHGPMILATRDGAKFSETAADFRLTREQQEALRAAAQRIAEQLRGDKEVITPRAAMSVAQATESIGQGPHPERGSVYGLATVKNISIVLVGGAAVATPALIGAMLGSVAIGALAGAPFSFVAVEAVKKSAAFNALVTQLGAKLDTISDDELRAWLEERGRRYAPFRRFVARNAEPLRKIAEATPELKWMLRYIDFISGDADQK